MDNEIAINDVSVFFSIKKATYSFIKRLFDIICSLIGIIILIIFSL